MIYKNADHSQGQDYVLLKMFNEANMDVMPIKLNTDDVSIRYISTNEKNISLAEMSIQSGHRLYKDEILKLTYEKAELKDIQTLPSRVDYKLTKEDTNSIELIDIINTNYSIKLLKTDIIDEVYNTKDLFSSKNENIISIKFSDSCLLYKGNININVTTTERLLDEAKGIITPPFDINMFYVYSIYYRGVPPERTDGIFTPNSASGEICIDNYKYTDEDCINYLLFSPLNNVYMSELLDCKLFLKSDDDVYNISILNVFSATEFSWAIQFEPIPISVLGDNVLFGIKSDDTEKIFAKFIKRKLIKLNDIINGYHSFGVKSVEPELNTNDDTYNIDLDYDIYDLIYVSELLYHSQIDINKSVPISVPVYYADSKFVQHYNGSVYLNKIIFNILSDFEKPDINKKYQLMFINIITNECKIIEVNKLTISDSLTTILIEFNDIDVRTFGQEVDVYYGEINKPIDELMLILKFSKIVLPLTSLSKSPLLKHGMEYIGSINELYSAKSDIQCLNKMNIGTINFDSLEK